jgi:hypothetical protein
MTRVYAYSLKGKNAYTGEIMDLQGDFTAEQAAAACPGYHMPAHGPALRVANTIIAGWNAVSPIKYTVRTVEVPDERELVGYLLKQDDFDKIWNLQIELLVGSEREHVISRLLGQVLHRLSYATKFKGDRL